MTEVSSKRRAGEEGNEIWEELRGPRGGRSEARAVAGARPALPSPKRSHIGIFSMKSRVCKRLVKSQFFFQHNCLNLGIYGSQSNESNILSSNRLIENNNNGDRYQYFRYLYQASKETCETERSLKQTRDHHENSCKVYFRKLKIHMHTFPWVYR